MSNYNEALQGNNADLQGILDSIRALPDASGGGIEPLAEYAQMTPLVAEYMETVHYTDADYSVSEVLPYIYRAVDYPMGYPRGYDVAIQQAGVLHLMDSVAAVHAPSVVGTNTLYNAIPGEVAHWWHTVADNVTHSGTIRPTGQVRMIQTTAKNVRDLGGWACDGGTIEYGKLFRGGLLDASDRAVLVDQLKIRHDLDLRGKTDNGGLTASPLGDDIDYICPDHYVMYSLANEETWTLILSTIFGAVARNEPVIFHCAAGADRTGTVACIVEAMLGVRPSDIDKDYELTSFSIALNARQRTSDSWKGLMAEINAIAGETFRDKVVNWAGHLGFTADEINSFRQAMIDGTPGNITVEDYTPAPPEEPEVNLFDASKAELNKRIGSSGSLSACNGMVTSDYIPIDSSMRDKRFNITGVSPVPSTTYSYVARAAYYAPDTKAFLTGFHINYAEDDWAGWVYAWDPDATTDTAFIRITLVIKDNVAITADDIANIKITLE